MACNASETRLGTGRPTPYESRLESILGTNERVIMDRANWNDVGMALATLRRLTGNDNFGVARIGGTHYYLSMGGGSKVSNTSLGKGPASVHASLVNLIDAHYTLSYLVEKV